MRKFDATDLKALQQAMEIFQEEYTVIRKKVSRFGDNGRFDPIEIKETIKGSIQEDSKSLSPDGHGNGENEWENASYTLTLVYPQYVNTGDIILTEEFGRLKVMGKSSHSKLRGTSSYDLVRTGTNEKVKNDIDYVY